MTSANQRPSTNQLLTETGYSPYVRHKFTTQGTNIEIIVLPDRILIYQDEVSLPAGILQTKDVSSGTIWAAKDPIGEYTLDANGWFLITELRNRSITKLTHEEDPLGYLINFLVGKKHNLTRQQQEN